MSAQRYMAVPKGSQGFTLIELMIGIAIFALLVALGLPSYNVWIQNTQIRTATESVLDGLQLARVEAARRNTNVEFVLGPGTDWSVNVAATGVNIQTRASSDGSKNIVANSAGGLTKATFNGLGRVTATNADGSNPITQIDFSSNVLAGTRSLRIKLELGGIIRMCDPQVTDAGDPRICI